MAFHKSYIAVILLLMHCFVFNTFVIAQQGDSIDVASILGKAILGYESEVLKNSEFILRSMDYGLPLIEKIEFRTETERMTFGRQELMLRTSFNEPKVRKALLNKRKSFLTLQSIENESVIREKILDQYRYLLQCKSRQQDLKIIKEKQTLENTLLKLYETILASGYSAELTDYLRARKSIVATEYALEQTTSEMNNIKKELGIAPETKIAGLNEMISVSDAIRIIQILNIDFNNHYLIKEKEAELKYLDSDFRYSTARSSRILDFFQARYTVREDLLFENRFSLGFGLQLPWRGSAKIDKNDNITKQVNTQSEADFIKINLEKRFKILLREFELKQRQYNDMIALENDPAIRQLRQRILDSDKVDPVKILKMKESDLEFEKDLSKIEYELLNIYLDILHNTGVLYEKPYKNHLSPLLPEIFLD
jgi:hypothetical protein